MASFFRKRIAEKVLWSIGSVYRGSRDDLNAITPLVKVDLRKTELPKLLLPFAKLCKTVPIADSNISPQQVVRTIRNQGLPTAEGIVDIEFDEAAAQSLVFTVDKHVFNRIVLLDVCVELDNISKNSCLLNNIPKKKILISFKSPLLGRPLTLGHLRSLFRCNCFTNICEYLNHTVSLLHSVDDWGPNCGMLLCGYRKFGSDEELERNASYHLSEILKVTNIKYNEDPSFQEELSTTMDEMENGDPLTLSLHHKLQSAWLKDLGIIFKRLGMKFTDVQCDSVFHKRIKETSDDLLQKNFISIESDRTIKMGSHTENEGDSPSLKDSLLGTEFHSLSRTICSAVIAKEYADFDDLYFISEKKHSNFYKLVNEVLEAMGFLWSRNVQPIYHQGLVQQEAIPSTLASLFLDRAKTGVLKELKTVITLDLGAKIDEVAENVMLSCLIMNDLKRGKNKKYVFRWDDMTNFGRDSCASYQFVHAGLLKLQEESDIKFKFDIDLSPLSEQIVVHLVQHLARFDEAILNSYTYFEPAFLVHYIQKLCYLTGRATDTLKLDIKEERLRVIKARLLLFHAVQKVLHQSFKLLGIHPLDSL